MDIVLNKIGKDCFGIVIDFLKMKDEYDMVVQQLKHKKMVYQIDYYYYSFHMVNYFLDDRANEKENPKYPINTRLFKLFINIMNKEYSVHSLI
jgi:hypothetical protein